MIITFDHATFIGMGNMPDQVSAVCDPPRLHDGDPFCWADRDPVAAAVSSGGAPVVWEVRRAG